MKKITWSLTAQCILFLLLSGMALQVEADAPSYIWEPLRIGAGGWLVGMDIAPDGTKVVRADTYGAYLWNGSQWVQLVNATSMPAADVTTGNSYGVYEIRIAPSNSSRFYMMYNGSVYRSDDKGATWSKTAFAAVTGCDANDNYRTNGQKAAVDPANPDVAYVGTTLNGVWVTSNGGTSWAQVSAIPVGGVGGITGIAFDPTSGTTGGMTNTIYVGSWGNGVYCSTNAGLGWTKTTGGPTTVNNAMVASSGIYYAADGTAAWKYAAGAWSSIYASGGWHSIAVDPTDANHLVVGSGSGGVAVSATGGGAWVSSAGLTRTATDIPWLAWTNESWMSNGTMIFDPSQSDVLYFAEGIGVWRTTPPNGGATAWVSQSAGIEQLCANEIICPPGGKPLVGSWDRPVFYVNNPDVYPSTHGPNNQNAIIMGWALDYAASNPAFIAGLFNFGGVEESSYSTDGGQTWHRFPAHPANQGTGGSIAAASPTNIVWAPEGNLVPYYTTNGGTTWTLVNAPGAATTGETGWGSAYYFNRHIVAADRATIGTFYLYNYLKGVYRSTDSGGTWALVHAGELTSWSGFSAELKAVPGQAGNLFFTGGPQSGYASEPFVRSIDSGVTWTPVPTVTQVFCFGFGMPASGGGYPSIFIVGWVSGVYGIWQSDDNAQSWNQIGTWPIGSLDGIKTISGDPNTYGMVYVGFSGSGYVYGRLSTMAAGPRAVNLSPSTANFAVSRDPAGERIRVTYVLAKSGRICVNVYNAKGGLVRNLVGETQTAGSHSIVWDQRDVSANRVANGAYYVEVTVDKKVMASGSIVTK